jgi:hypothetical protein
MSGGTGAGLLFDIIHLLRSITQTGDMMFNVLPMPTTYHQLATSTGQKQQMNAQNFAGMINLMRFMSARSGFPTIIQYSDMITVRNEAIMNIPFLIDGDTDEARLNDVPPRLGVVPAVSDFIITLIKDNMLTSAIQPRCTDWSQTYIGNADISEKYAAFGCSSIRYAYKEILNTFSYRFTVALYNSMLDPMGGDIGKGANLANSILTGITFTQMVADPNVTPCSAPTPPDCKPDFKALGTKIRTGKSIDAPFIYAGRNFIEQVPHAGFIFGKEAIDVKKQTEKLMNRLQEDVVSWISRQRTNIDNLYLDCLEKEVKNIFYNIEDEKITPKTLQHSPCSVVIARDMLAVLRTKLETFKTYVSSQYENNLYPTGSRKVNIISAHLAKLNEIEKKIGKDKASQEAYLKEAQRHIDIEVWSLLMQGIINIATDLLNQTHILWNKIGDDADGWVKLLEDYRIVMKEKHQADIARRKEFDDMRLRKYVPTTAGATEDQLFMEVAEPALEALKARMSWQFAVEPHNPDRYSLLMNSPLVQGYNMNQALSDLQDVITKERLKSVANYNPFMHYSYALQELDGPLNAKTIWNILELECEYDWCQNEKVQPDKRNKENFISQLVEEFTKKSKISLNFDIGSNKFEQEFTLGQFPNDGIGGMISAGLRNKKFNLIPHDGLAKELRRVQCHFRVPIKQWSSFSEAEADYINYVDSSGRQTLLIDIYVHEQHAAKLRNLVEKNVDSNFTHLLDISLVSFLYDLELFRKSTFCYLLGLIPLKDGEERTAPKLYYFDFSQGQITLAEEWDIYSLFHTVNAPEVKMNKTWRSNKDVREKIIALWKEKEDSHAKSKTLAQLATSLENSVSALTFPEPPVGKTDELGQIGRDHLKLVMKAMVLEYKAALLK